MCGQLGYSGTKPFDFEKIKLLILWNSLERGEDATGLYSPLNGHRKSLLKGSTVVSNDEFKLIPDTILMAHVRAKTIGLNTIENTHPFKRGDWYLQHNGTLKNHWDLSHKYELSSMDYSVDSDIICGAISKENNFNPLREIDGPAAIIIHKTTTPDKLYVFRNAERPLFRGIIDGCMYMSSIKESLEYIGCGGIKEFKTDTLYTICNGNIEKTVKMHNAPYKRPYVNNYNNSYGYSNVNTYSNAVQATDLVNSWLKASFNDSSSTRKFNLIQGKLYFISGISEYQMLQVKERDEENAPFELFHKSYFYTSGYIDIWDYAVALYDIVNDKKQIVIKKDQVVLVTKITDNILSLEDINTKKDICCADRRYFRIAEDHETKIKTNNAINDYSTTNSYFDSEGYYDSYDDYYVSRNQLNTNQHPLITDNTNSISTPLITSSNKTETIDFQEEIDVEEVFIETDKFFNNLDVELQMAISTLSKGYSDDTHDLYNKLKEIKVAAEELHYKLLTIDQII